MNNTKTIDTRVFDGIRKTINRFREKPFHYFTEADIHSSLLNDMMSGGSDVLTYRDKESNITVSLVHQEYPTNFRYEKEMLLGGYKNESEIKKTGIDFKDASGKTYGDRGNFDLAVLNQDFIENIMKKNKTEALNHIINKDIVLAISRKKQNKENFDSEILYAIEVKFIHPNNARNVDMLYEVVKDDNKLRLAYLNLGKKIRPVNLVFCSVEKQDRSDKKTAVIEKIKDYISLNDGVQDYKQNMFVHPAEILTIFIESFISEGDKKITGKPIESIGTNEPWSADLLKKN